MLVSVIQCDITPHDTTNTALVLFIRLCKCSHKQYPNIHATLVSIFTQNYVQIRNLTLHLNFVPTLAFPSWLMTCLYLLKRTRIKEAKARTLDIEQWAHYHHVSMSVGCFLKLHFHSHRWWSSVEIYNNFW